MRIHTHRDLLVWIIWMDKQLNAPDRTAYYLMQIAAEIRRANVKNPSKVKIEDMRLKFDMFKKCSKIPKLPSQNLPNLENIQSSTQSDTRLNSVTEEQLTQATASSKAMWLSAVGLTENPK